jgi:NADH-quinone oxidoreductase subunit C
VTLSITDLERIIGNLAGKDCLNLSVAFGELTLTISPSALNRVMASLKDNPQCPFRVLIDICGVDFPDRPQRFDVVYHLLSLHQNVRLRLKVAVDLDQTVPSIAHLFNSANWCEREVWDLYGIPFTDHPDLRRLLTDYNFDGHPLRKDFPLTGYVEVRYDDEARRVVYDTVSLPQAYRTFDYLSPWEGMIEGYKPKPVADPPPAELKKVAS